MARQLGREYNRPIKFGYHGYYHPTHNSMYDDEAVRWDPHFIGRLQASDFLIGFEWELEGLGSDNDDAMLAITTALGYPCNKYHMLTVANDGSLHSDGAEIISEPCTPDILFNYNDEGIDLDKGCKKARELGAIGEIDRDRGRGGHAGIHLNLNRERVKNVHGEETPYLMVLLFNNNKDWIMDKFSRRSFTENGCSYCEYDHNRPRITYDDVIHRRSYVNTQLCAMYRFLQEHSRAIAMNKDHVYEFRLFASTTVSKYFKAAIQLVILMGWCVKYLKMEQIVNVDFGFIRQMAEGWGYTEFLEYCKVSRIGITEGQYNFQK